MAIEKAIDVVREQKESMKEKIGQEKGREPTKAELKKIKKVKINITDHDAKFMKERNGVIKPNYCTITSVFQGYNQQQYLEHVSNISIF